MGGGGGYLEHEEDDAHVAQVMRDARWLALDLSGHRGGRRGYGAVNRKGGEGGRGEGGLYVR